MWGPASPWYQSVCSIKSVHSQSANWPSFPTPSQGLIRLPWWKFEAPVSTTQKRRMCQKCTVGQMVNGWYPLATVYATLGMRSGAENAKLAKLDITRLSPRMPPVPSAHPTATLSGKEPPRAPVTEAFSELTMMLPPCPAPVHLLLP
uniref:Macaca fascicularis brain cDNA clone: QflA-22251, similar to human EphA4 (EPHA4), mRNA, RefSeq: NM_004438.3 n=1 Tax=Macaca fascicularis TaxID=9541 RepID=I7GLV1_MACFA|nr:unnamed protein product [Macaca fascicularis]